jgi:hypothetical protein
VCLFGVVGVAVLGLASSCGLLDSGQPPPAVGQMGGPAFNNAGDNGPMVLLTVVVVVVLFAAGMMAAALFRAWRDDRAELRWRERERSMLPPDQQVPMLNGQPLYRSGYRPEYDRDYRQLGR